MLGNLARMLVMTLRKTVVLKSTGLKQVPYNCVVGNIVVSQHQQAGFGPLLGCGYRMQGFEMTQLNHVECTKTNHVNVTTFSHVEWLYAFELSQFSELFFFQCRPND